MMKLSGYLVICTVLYTVAGYPSGAPDGACQSMVPGHPPTTATRAPPFMIKLSSNKYQGGASLSGQIYSPSGKTFKGFLLQVRKSVGAPNPVGTFSGFNTTMVHTVCGTNDNHGITHSDATPKTMVNFTWMPPSDLDDDVRFNLTVVESYKPSVYWTGITSDAIAPSLN